MSNLSMLHTNNEVIVERSDSRDSLSSWSISTKKGTVAGIGVEVSGSGALGKITGCMEFEIKNIIKSKSYLELKEKFGINGGISAFWSWLCSGGNAQDNQEAIAKFCTDISATQNVKGKVNINLDVTGKYPNVAVYAYAYVLVLQITDSRGNKYNVCSIEDPISNTGATDSQGNTLPVKNNDSVIIL